MQDLSHLFCAKYFLVRKMWRKKPPKAPKSDAEFENYPVVAITPITCWWSRRFSLFWVEHFIMI